jgi:hypothetical protein
MPGDQTPVGEALGTVRPGAHAAPPLAGPAMAWARSRNARTAAVWIGVGFVAGAVFCLAVGRGVLADNAHVAQETSMQSVPAAKAAALTNPAAPALPTIYLVDPVNCSALQLNRETNRTKLRPCPSTGLALRLDPQTGPEDLAGLTSTTAQASTYEPN